MSFIPRDRVLSLLTGSPLPSSADGAVLFADISGFSKLPNDLLGVLGRRRGAEMASRVLNDVYGKLLSHVHLRSGFVISFSGDGVLCWFPDTGPDAEVVAVALDCAQAMVDELSAFTRLTVAKEVTVRLGIKVAIAYGRTRRMLVGDPDLQLIKVLAGEPVDATGEAEQLASQGEIVIRAELVPHVADAWAIVETRSTDNSASAFAVVQPKAVDALHELSSIEYPQDTSNNVDAATARKWIHPAVYERITSSGDEFLAELCPCVALFCRFGGLDVVHDPEAENILNAYIRWAQRVVHRHGGALKQLTTGDNGSYFFAAFGAPVQ